MPRRTASPAKAVGKVSTSSTPRSPAKASPGKPVEAVAQSWLYWWPDGVGGISSKGLFGHAAPWVNMSKPPGTTDQSELLSFKTTLNSVITGRHFFLAPHSTWAAIALLMYLICPYEEAITTAKHGWAVGWMAKRLVLNLSVATAYYSLFHIGLWRLGWGKRKYLADVYPTAGNMRHNLFYWSLGILQWTLWDCVMIRLWATGKVPYTSNAELLSSWRSLVLNVFAVFMTPCWRDTHFYIVHRFSHLRAVYKFVHSLHHRNTDPEPFSGLCMHPIEHLYYFSNAWTPALYLTLSPFIFLYTFVHLAIAPGAGHSGFEDHFQSDQYHYLHHQKFECNYGSPFSASIDMACGTFREALGTSRHYSGEWNEGAVKAAKLEDSAPGPKKVWSKHSYLGMPASISDGVYTAFWVSLFPLMYWAAVSNHSGRGGAIVAAAAHAANAVSAVGGVGSSEVNAGKAMGETMRQAALRRTGRTVGRLGSWLRATTLRGGSGSAAVVGSAELYVASLAGLPSEVVVAAAVAYAPIALALLLAKLSGDRMSWRWPFHKEKLVGTLGIFLLLGWLCCMLPTYHAVRLISEPIA